MTRYFQWMVGTPKVTTYMGCIGKDKFGEILAEKARGNGVNVEYQIHDKEPTGTCAVLITDKGNNRCKMLKNIFYILLSL